MNISISENKRDRDTRFMGDQEWGGWKGKAGWRSTLCSTLNVMLKSLKSIVKRMWSHPKVKNRRNECLCQGKYTDGTAHPGGSILIICLSSLLTGSPGKEHRINQATTNQRVQAEATGGAHVCPPPRILLAGVHLGGTMCAAARRTLRREDPEAERPPEEPDREARAGQSAWALSPSGSPPGHPLQ